MPDEKALTPEQRTMLESERLGERMNDLAADWDELTVEDLVQITFRVFMDGQRRTTYLGVLLWAAEFPKGFLKHGRSGRVVMLDVNPLHNKAFKKMFLVDLGNDVSERLRQSGDLLSALAYLNAGLAKRSTDQFVRPQLVNEQFKRAKKTVTDG